ncbi:MAG: 23S rRNA (adenine(2503)-C(2))-methyltransferase RlmN [Thermoanaerobaculales bacterium]
MRPVSNLVGKTSEAIKDLVAPQVGRDFHPAQVARWVNVRNVTSFEDMTDLPKDLRRHLSVHFALREPKVVEIIASADGSRKYLFGCDDGVAVEGVAMLDGAKATLCLSSQAGCAVGCTFCVTGAFGAGRNLRPDEIVGQYRIMLRDPGTDVERVNLVFMGMGEPLLNTEHLGNALDVLTEQVSPKRITVSTAGILPGIRWLGRRPRPPKLAISLNAPDQDRRLQIMPIARRYPLEDLIAELRRFPLDRGRRITFEYVLIRGFNDSTEDAGLVARLLRGIPSKVNVIPLNEDREHFPELERPPVDTIDAFAAALRDAGLTITVRWSKGADVAAACGQLRGRHAGGAAVR